MNAIYLHKTLRIKSEKIAFDEKADALYIQFQKGKVKRTLKLEDGILIDIGEDEKIFGIEILDVSERIQIKNLNKVDIRLPVMKGGQLKFNHNS